MEYYAHTAPPGGRPQLLKDHLCAVADLAERFAKEAQGSSNGDTPGMLAEKESFCAAAKWSGLLHDLGKYSDDFQEMLREVVEGKRKRRVPHAVYGAAHAREAEATDIALCLLGHHAGLHSAKKLQKKTSPGTIGPAYEELLRNANRPDELGDLLGGGPARVPASLTEHKLQFELRLRMLFSCLIDADRLDSFRHDHGHIPERRSLDACALLERLLTYIESRSASVDVPTVKIARRWVLEACLEAAPRADRLFSLTVPTGGGKTLASMAFALRRAISRPEEVRRIIVVIPYLSIIEQNAQAYADALGPEAVFEHHSGDSARLDRIPAPGERGEAFVPAEEGEDDMSTGQERAQRLAAENWDAPIVVTTSVRFFESLYSNRPSDLRRVHNTARSVVILDEVQTLPKGFLGTLLSMIGSLAECWGTTFVFSTATQPAFEKQSNSSASDLRWHRGTIKPIIPERLEKRLFADLKRVAEPVWPGPTEKWSLDDLAARLAGERRVLCIVNLKRHARELYEEMTQEATDCGLDASRIFYLSTRMCAKHRLDRLAEIRRVLDDESLSCHVISTQLVEAGVDLDFPVVYRAMGPFDSIIQAAGRCDREGKLTAAAGEPAGRLVVFRLEDGGSPYREATDVTEGLIAAGGLSIHEPAHVRAYFQRLYEGDGDPQDIEALRGKLDFPGVAERFAMIDDRTKAVFVPYDDEGRDLIHQLERSQSFEKNVLRALQRHQVGLYPQEFDEARELGTIVDLWPESDLWGCKVSCYSDEIGLRIIQPSAEDLMG